MEIQIKFEIFVHRRFKIYENWNRDIHKIWKLKNISIL